MKYLFIAILLTALSSCNKDWQCTVTTNGIDSNPTYFHGTSEEKDAWEAQGTQTITVGNQVYVQETNCVPE